MDHRELYSFLFKAISRASTPRQILGCSSKNAELYKMVIKLLTLTFYKF